MSYVSPEYQRQYAKDHPERKREYSRKWYKKTVEDPDGKRRLRHNHLMKRYGITMEQWDEMYAWQKGLCAICSIPLEDKKTQVDHDHDTNAVRGLLCTRCNLVLGAFERTAHRVAIDAYLDNPPARHVLSA